MHLRVSFITQYSPLYQTGSRLKPNKQEGYTLLLVTTFQACSCNIAGFRTIGKILA